MKQIKKFLLITIVVLLSSGCQTNNSSNQEKLKVGIIQIVEHPALDAAREGFIDELAKNGYVDQENIIINYKNAQGDINTLNTIAQSFASEDYDLIFAIATPSAQAAANATTTIPILFTAVTDPIEAKLVGTLDSPNGNLSGTSDAISIENQLKLLKQINPDAKNVGFIFNTSEVNSEVQLKQAKEIAKELNLTIVEKGITSTNEVKLATETIAPKIDALFIPTDNMIASSLPVIMPIAIENKIIVIGSEKAHVQAGALITDGISYFKLGQQTAQMAIKVFKGQEISKMPVEFLKETEIIINKVTANKLSLTIPQDIIDQASIVLE